MESEKAPQEKISLDMVKSNPEQMIDQAKNTHQPVVITDRDKNLAVVQSIEDYQQAKEEQEFMRAVIQGLADTESGDEYTLEQAKQRLGIK